MAYTCWYSGNNLISSDDCTAATSSGFEACGWDLHDSYTSTYDYKVYTSKGEENQYLPGFVQFWHQNALIIYFNYYMYWDADTHIGEVKGYYQGTYTPFYFAVNKPLIAYGDRDWIILHTIAATTSNYNRLKSFGFIKPYDDKTVTLTENVTAGSDKLLTVSGSLGDFINDRKYMIVGDQTEGRDPIQVDWISGSTVTGTLTVANVPRNYDAGAIIGHTPYTFFAYSTNAIRMLCDYTVAGVADTNNSPVTTLLLARAGVDPDINTNRYILQPSFYKEIADSATPIGYLTASGMAYCPAVAAMATYDKNVLFTMGAFESGSSTGSSTSTSLNDISKVWDTDVHAGKVFIYTNGAGEGQTRVIASNDTNTLHWNTPLHTIPALYDEYRIYEGEVWRQLYIYTCRELIY